MSIWKIVRLFLFVSLDRTRKLLISTSCSVGNYLLARWYKFHGIMSTLIIEHMSSLILESFVDRFEGISPTQRVHGCDLMKSLNLGMRTGS